MKALTLTQPWATLVAAGVKHIETRAWGTSYRGPIAIHAAKGLNVETFPHGDEDLATLCSLEPFKSALIDAGFYYEVAATVVPAPLALPRGQIIAVATLDRVTRMTEQGITGLRDLHPREHAFGYYEPGRYAWVLRDTQLVRPPAACRGALGLWTVPDDVAATLPAVEAAA